MIRTLCFLLLCALRPAGAAEGLSPSAQADALSDDDVYYAPIDDAEAATPAAQALPQGSFVSHATLRAFDIADGKPLEGAELFLAGAYLGRSPLSLGGQVLAKPELELAASLDGYTEGLRPAVAVPAEGEVAVALASDRAAGWYTTPAWAVGLGLLIASAAIYDSHNSGPGLALAGGGLGVISLSQLAARFVHLPLLRRRAQAYNERREPVPPLERP